MTAMQRLLEAKLGEPLGVWVAWQRTAGLSWLMVAEALAAKTGESVNQESLRRWYR